MIAFCTGCFDPFHKGHAAFLGYALSFVRKDTDILIVAVNSDDYIRRMKRREPFQNEVERLRKVRQYVPCSFLFDNNDPEKLIRAIKPNIYVTGAEYRGKIDHLEYIVHDACLGKTVFFDRVGDYSSTKERAKVKYSEAQKMFVNNATHYFPSTSEAYADRL